MAGVLAAAGVTHLVNPKPYDQIVPRALPGSPRTYTYVSGVVELALAAGLVHPRTRRAAGLASAGFFAAVFPANVKMAIDWRHAPPVRRAIAYGRLPLQLPLVLWGLRVARAAPASPVAPASPAAPAAPAAQDRPGSA
ncbi:DoxX family protein [Dactylosporangium cerinum]